MKLRFSLRDLVLVVAGTSVLLGALSWVMKDIDQDRKTIVTLFYSLPILTGMGGLLFGQLRGGIRGAILGATILVILLRLLG